MSVHTVRVNSFYSSYKHSPLTSVSKTASLCVVVELTFKLWPFSQQVEVAMQQLITGWSSHLFCFSRSYCWPCSNNLWTHPQCGGVLFTTVVKVLSHITNSVRNIEYKTVKQGFRSSLYSVMYEMKLFNKYINFERFTLSDLLCTAWHRLFVMLIFSTLDYSITYVTNLTLIPV